MQRSGNRVFASRAGKCQGRHFSASTEVQDDRLVVLVVAVGKRDRNEVYKNADRR
jgi:hypothetical protein